MIRSDFKHYKLTSTDLDLDKDSKTNQAQDSTNKLNNQESRFKLENIYIINQSNYNEALRAIKDYRNTSKLKENLLVMIVEKINVALKLEKPNNTYLYYDEYITKEFEPNYYDNKMIIRGINYGINSFIDLSLDSQGKPINDL